MKTIILQIVYKFSIIYNALKNIYLLYNILSKKKN